MKIFLSINKNFFVKSPKELIELIKEYDINKMISGFEVYVQNRDEETYLKRFSKYAIDSGYEINMHAPVIDSIEYGRYYLDFVKEISDITNRKINVAFHPLDGFSVENSRAKTRNIVKDLIDYIIEKDYINNIDLSVENLNILNNLRRLRKEEIEDILEENDNTKFTYDIGHETVDKIDSKKLDKILEERLSNIHIHTNKNMIDHMPIKDLEKEETIKNLLEIYAKDNPVVLEYGLDFIKGNTFEEKLKEYINLAKVINI